MRLAVIGAGAIGLTHCQAITATDGFELAGIADPFATGATLAAQFGTRHYRDHAALLAAERPDGAIVATPNETHVPIALDCLAAGVPVIVEKPLANTVAEAVTLLEAERRTGLAVLVGHHRRHQPFLQRARDIVASGGIGRLVAISASAFMLKPQDYFGPDWRRTPGVGGTFRINLIHEIDLIRFVCGEIVALSAFAANAVRGLAVEDTGALIFQLDNGALASLVVSDAAAGPWSWDLTAGDVPRFPVHDVDSHRIVGTEGALTLPRMEVWRHDGEAAWTTPMAMTRDPVAREDPYVNQIEHFRAVVEDGAATFVGAVEGARNLAVMEAVMEATRTGRTVEVARLPEPA